MYVCMHVLGNAEGHICGMYNIYIQVCMYFVHVYCVPLHVCIHTYTYMHVCVRTLVFLQYISLYVDAYDAWCVYVRNWYVAL